MFPGHCPLSEVELCPQHSEIGCFQLQVKYDEEEMNSVWSTNQS